MKSELPEGVELCGPDCRADQECARMVPDSDEGRYVHVLDLPKIEDRVRGEIRDALRERADSLANLGLARDAEVTREAAEEVVGLP